MLIPEDLVDNNASSCGSGAVPDIFFKCLYQELENNSSGDVKENEEETFSNLMNQNGNGNMGWYGGDNDDKGKMKNKLSQMDLVWQALKYCANNDEWREDRSIVKDDVDVNTSNSFEKQNVLPAIEV